MASPFTGQLLSGAGNRFLVLDNRTLCFPYARIPHLCREFDTDGVLLLEPELFNLSYGPASSDDEGEKPKNQFFMRVFNKDGSEASMCGNGIRCFVWFLRELKICEQRYHIQTHAGTYLAWFEGSTVCTSVPTPPPAKQVREGLYWIHTGVPHLVHFTEEITKAPVLEMGPLLRYSPQFAPEGANVNFVEILKIGHLAIRTYERGVEGETLACGTGALACSVTAHQLFAWQSPIFVTVQSGDTLKVSFSLPLGKISLQGPVTPLTKTPFLYSLNTLQ